MEDENKEEQVKGEDSVEKEVEKEDEGEKEPQTKEESEKMKQKARELGDRMKKIEQAQEVQLVPWQPYIVRLDGHHFSAFTKQFKKPYDERIFQAMLKTSTDLLQNFNAVTAYTQSDEITLVFPPVRRRPDQTEKNIIYDGRIGKLATLMAGYCSIRFVYHMLQTKFEEGEDEEGFKRKIFQTHFDARAFSLPSSVEVLENIAWRISDVKRNSKSNLGFSHFTPKELRGLSPYAVVKKLLTEKGVDWNDMPPPYKFGCFIKRERYRDNIVDSKTGQITGTTMRTRYSHAFIDLHALCLKEGDEGIMMPLVEQEHRQNINLLMEKFVTPDWVSLFEPLPPRPYFEE